MEYNILCKNDEILKKKITFLNGKNCHDDKLNLMVFDVENSANFLGQ